MADFGDNAGDTVSINITPMMDVFSILIVFLLMSYSTDPVVVDPLKGVELPDSLTLTSLDEIPIIRINRMEVLVNDRKIADIVGDDISQDQQAQGGIQALYDELEKLKEANDRIREMQGKPKRTGTITMEMDKNLPFRIARRVMLSAQQAEFVTFKLMTKRTNS